MVQFSEETKERVSKRLPPIDCLSRIFLQRAQAFPLQAFLAPGIDANSDPSNIEPDQSLDAEPPEVSFNGFSNRSSCHFSMSDLRHTRV
ncbi:hypothetical protein POX_c04445 [Penicillium oxalicum]|uniref:hypothetical protein n=1 Tax=Penicillium oxalicum TaxID=69781 RepID=UPI0020B88458|nr:hypothetical protein POX_c04445 [Penicillium oxalicum]KAI2791583.1 hypothetical protein POX_c04445 [Penicillium oxalicum]